MSMGRKYDRRKLKRHDRTMKFRKGTDPRRDITGKVAKRKGRRA